MNFNRQYVHGIEPVDPALCPSYAFVRASMVFDDPPHILFIDTQLDDPELVPETEGDENGIMDSRRPVPQLLGISWVLLSIVTAPKLSTSQS